ncbi:hypothetical protein AJ80_07208 [Polytolypa hystricis UAMH7299]|uniref:Transcription factor TFIIIC triple barrel domain-containing protein n=1 Tax=Polytolypa hystricis (strain UAMH7299) TaxID=1447883 RepID=A0A2B7XR16_POLH7|nr:hypothetical protein AJ80_07208 [Polytolypa hystricis UAMH7299]
MPSLSSLGDGRRCRLVLLAVVAQVFVRSQSVAGYRVTLAEHVVTANGVTMPAAALLRTAPTNSLDRPSYPKKPEMPPSSVAPLQDPPVGLMSDDSDYEYEYDELETETFYLNLDLTSCNGLIRRRSVPASSSRPSSSMQRSSSPSARSPRASIVPEEEQQSGIDTDSDLQDQIQIMDLHSENPIISYQNQIFSCSWVDLVGTELMLSFPEERSEIPVLRRERDFDLISASRVKLLGQKTNLISSAGIRPTGGVRGVVVGSIDAASSTSLFPRGAPMTNQGRFLERLIQVKQAKGESDFVRTQLSQKKNQNIDSRLHGWARTEEQMAEIERLNRRAHQGDVNAIEALDSMYSGMDGTAPCSPPAQQGTPSQQFGSHARPGERSDIASPGGTGSRPDNDGG